MMRTGSAGPLPRNRRVALFIGGTIAAPLLATGLYRLAGYYTDALLIAPTVLFGLLAIGLWRVAPRLRSLLFGLVVGGLTHVLLMLWAFVQLG